MTKSLTGKDLNELWGVGAKHALYRETGKWYHQLKLFPGALFDANGYIIFKTRTEYLNCEYLQIKKDIHVPLGIANIPGYERITEKTQLQLFTHQIKEVSDRQSLYSVTKKPSKTNRKPLEPKTPEATDLSGSGIPKRKLGQTYRILRDTKIARWVKYIHQYKCQVCGLAIKLRDGELYAEAHHIKPLGRPHNGPDVLENIICVCPNHHAQLDYKAIKLNKSELILIPAHDVSDEYVNYYNQEMLDGEVVSPT